MIISFDLFVFVFLLRRHTHTHWVCLYVSLFVVVNAVIHYTRLASIHFSFVSSSGSYHRYTHRHTHTGTYSICIYQIFISFNFIYCFNLSDRVAARARSHTQTIALTVRKFCFVSFFVFRLSPVYTHSFPNRKLN